MTLVHARVTVKEDAEEVFQEVFLRYIDNNRTSETRITHRAGLSK